MKNFKSLLPFLLMLFVWAGCDTDDLRNDVDELKNRVESLEAQVSAINDNMNAIRVILDGSKTISSYTSENGTYTLTLSDGSTIALTQGSEGQIVMPDITINENGQWVLNGEVIGQATGNSGITPKFNISADKYWQVSFDGGKTYEDVLDENDNKVAATTEGNVSVSDAFFKDVKVEGDMLKVTLKDDQSYSLPIVADLKANIVDPTTGFKDGVWTIGYGETVKTEVEISGDNYFVTVPAGGWTATLSEVSDGKATLTVTAPAQASTLSRATADNSTELVLQVNKGVNWAIDKIKVEADKVISSYYAEYLAGRDIIIGTMNGVAGTNSLTLNNKLFKDAQLISSDQEITEDGVYFVKENVKLTFNYDYSGSEKIKIGTLIIIGDNPDAPATITTSKTMSLYNPAGGEGLVLYNMAFDASEFNNYVINISDDATSSVTYNYLLFDKCRIFLPAGKNLIYINNKPNSKIKNIGLYNSYVNVPSADQANLFSWSNNPYLAETATIYNNVCYAEDGKGVDKFSLLSAANASSSFTDVLVKNNTLINLFGSNSYIKTKISGNLEIASNLMWSNAASAVNTTMINAVAGSNVTGLASDKYTNNVWYGTQVTSAAVFNTSGGAKPEPLVNNQLKSESSDPFVGGTFEWDQGVFVPGSGYETIGAHIE